MKKVMVAIPAYTGVVHMGTMRSLMTDLIGLIKRGDQFTLVDDIGNALIADCRGIIATKFYHSDCDELIFIDSDVAWEEGALLKLVDYPVDLCAGIYPTRTEPIKYCVHWLQERKELWADPNTGLLEVEAVPTGFMKISRNCITKMIEAYPQQYYSDATEDNLYWPLFEHYVDQDKGWKYGEDYSFCYKWRKINGQVWVDPELTMGHIGNKLFEGNLGKFLKSRIINS